MHVIYSVALLQVSPTVVVEDFQHKAGIQSFVSKILKYQANNILQTWISQRILQQTGNE